MWHPRVMYLRRITSVCLLLITVLPDLILGLRSVSVTVPTAVKKGDNAQLVCNFDLEGDTLYSVKWYKGRREFYRYTPKENPAMKIFPQQGITVLMEFSNQSHIILSSVEPNISGKYSCEVSADAPSFHTEFVSGEMEVVELPEIRPSLTGIHTRYRLEDVVNGNCSSQYSKPAANLTWTINDIPALKEQIKIYKPVKSPASNLESSVVEISFSIAPQHFVKGRLKLKCIAKIHQIYEQDVERYIEEDRPRILASGRSPDVNLFPLDHPPDGELTEHNEQYLTHYKADMASSGSSSSSITCVSCRSINTFSTTTIRRNRSISSLLTTIAVVAIFYAAVTLSIQSFYFSTMDVTVPSTSENEERRSRKCTSGNDIQSGNNNHHSVQLNGSINKKTDISLLFHPFSSRSSNSIISSSYINRNIEDERYCNNDIPQIPIKS